MKVIKMIIDAHTHIFPDKIASKASENIGNFYSLAMRFDGTTKKLIELGDKTGINKFLICSVATTAKQVSSINRFIADEVKNSNGRFIGFAALHPDCDNIEELINDAINNNLSGIKLHPDFQKFNIDDKKAYKIYEAAEGKLPILFHTGDYRTEYSKPQRLAKVAKDFPELDIIAAHFGGWSEWDNAVKYLKFDNIYVDTSSSLYELSPQKARELISFYGEDKVFFGSDYPMWNPETELKYIEKLNLSHDLYEKIMHRNFENLLEKYK